MFGRTKELYTIHGFHNALHMYTHLRAFKGSSTLRCILILRHFMKFSVHFKINPFSVLLQCMPSKAIKMLFVSLTSCISA